MSYSDDEEVKIPDLGEDDDLDLDDDLKDPMLDDDMIADDMDDDEGMAGLDGSEY